LNASGSKSIPVNPPETKIMAENRVKNKFQDFFEKLNPVQQEVVLCADGPSLVLAGAGSGKTRVLTCRIAHLIEERKAAPNEILAMTFTKKAANVMRERVAGLTGSQDAVWLGTFHSTFAKILRRESDCLNYPSDFVIYDKDDQEKLIKTILEDMGTSSKEYSVKALSAIISRSKNNLISPDAFKPAGVSPAERMAETLYPEYQKRLRACHAFDFDDLITAPIALFQSVPAVLAKYQSRFRFVLVDEYQDTNRAQYQLIRLLAGAHRNLTVVGDDDQSIYRWRGADIRNILDFEKDFPETRVFRLEQNYRSTRNILKAAGSVVEKNKDRKGKTLWSEREPGEKLVLIETEDEREEAQSVVEKIKEEVFRKKRGFRDFAVLYRTNAQSRALEDVLRRSGFSYVIIGSVRFYERKEIKDILAYLKLVSNPRDEISLRRILNFPVRGIGDISLGKVAQWAASMNLPLFDAIERCEEVPELSPRIQQNFLAFHRLIRKYIELRPQISVNELVHALVDEVGFLLLYKNEMTEEGQERLENVKELLTGVKEYTLTADPPSLSGFLEEVALVADVDSWNDKTNAITLMTLHCAKGMEFPVVLVTGLEEGLFPVSRSLEDPEALEEERRLFYVGLTRAMDKVYLFWAHRRNAAYDGGYRVPSRFLAEMDSSVVETPRPHFRQEVRRPSRLPAWDEDGSENGYREKSGETIQSSPYHKGMRVRHEIFGRGVVSEIEGIGDQQKVTVMFQGSGEKKFIAKYARFSILS
jgi:DNA helicase II / ATP-dependent DNA helicase PcrA